MFYHGYLKYVSGEQGLYKVGAMLSALGVPSGFEVILGTIASYAEMVGGILLIIGLFTRIGTLLVVGTLAVATILNLTAISLVGIIRPKWPLVPLCCSCWCRSL